MKRLVTNSELNCFRRCRRKWWLGYHRRLAPLREKSTGPRGLGTRLHLALAAHYAPEPQDPLTVFRQSFILDLAEAKDDDDGTKELLKDLDLGEKMLVGYLQWAEESGVDVGLTVYAVEQKVEAYVTSLGIWDIYLMGKLDARAYREWDDSRFFIDHKSVGSLTAPLATLQLDTQMLQYHALEQLDENRPEELTHGGLYNMLRRVKRTATAKPPFFAREEVRHNQREVSSYIYRLINQVRDMLRLENELDGAVPASRPEMAYPSPRATCSWDCEFLLVCPMFDDGSHAEDFLARYYKEHDPHAHYADAENGDDG